ncbi:helix-turn-helix domain-containing protein [Actinokineospora bangkokensis]|uniref:HTH cro/C1-type domain-containing protein n=1 Tax=Actinokineospora bangkokensis TaxID=1193682 RepID=A0A1Q9LIR4_9PSEU|nr:Scr1 family TA system antitoxin-like transcriptional regulator [Actinokineospora bangkokensis]OLR91916.1 hypothetical protein BJP25_24095 [Actinokineospora bangkokensis]
MGHDEIRPVTLRAAIIANRLNTARNHLGLTTRALAELMNMTVAMANRMMTGRRIPTSLQIGALCALLDIDPAQRPLLYDLTRTATDTTWLLPHHNTDSPHLIAEIEATANTAVHYHPHHIPLPARTPEYHHAITGHPRPATPPATPDPHRTLLIPETALTRTPTPPQVLRDQLDALLHGPWSVRVLPATEPPTEAFTQLHIPHFHPVIALDLLTTHLILEHPDTTTPYQQRTQDLLDHSLTDTDSLDTLRAHRTRLDT